MASRTRWTWVSVNSRSWWWTGRPGMLQFMGSQRVGHDWETDLIWSDLMVFPVFMNGCKSWTIKKAKHWRIDAFELWCCRRLLRVSWTVRTSNQSTLKEISPEYSLEAEAETRIFWPPDAKNLFTGKDPDVEKDWKWEEKGTTEDEKGATEDEMVRCHYRLNGHGFEQAPGVHDGQESLLWYSPWVTKSHTWLSSWIELRSHIPLLLIYSSLPIT